MATRVGRSQSRSGTASLCDLPAERLRLDEVRERALAVDLDDRQQLAVSRLQLRVARDVDLVQLEPRVGLRGADDALRRCAEVAALGVVQDDARRRAYG